jgi:hypothetical protein
MIIAIGYPKRELMGLQQWFLLNKYVSSLAEKGMGL